MNVRTRKFIGVVATVLVLVIYSLVAMVIGARILVGLPGWVQLPGFIALGLGWLPVVMWLIRWMQRPDASPQ